MSRFERSFLVGALASVGGAVPTSLSAPLDAVCTDTRTIREGALFVALVGERFDAHTFIRQAFEDGAGACVVEKSRLDGEVASTYADRLIYVDDTLAALQALASAHLRRLPGTVVGLTGSNGKTSTKELCAAALRSVLDGKSLCATKGNFNNHIGLPLTALEATEDDAVILLEMGMNHLGEIATLAEIARPTIGLVTNIGVAHGGNVGGVDGVAKAKGELFQALSKVGGTAIVNADDHRCREQAADVDKSVLFGWQSDADVRLERAAGATRGGVDCVVEYNAERIEFWVPYEGNHNALNAAAALALVSALGLDVSKAADGLASTPLSGGRLVRKIAANGALILDDTYNANPDSMRAGLTALVAAADGRRKVAVLGEMLELDAADDEHRKLGKAVVADGCAMLFVCGPLGKRTAEGAIAAGMAADQVQWAADSAALSNAVAAQISDRDAILVKGSRGSKMEIVVAALVASGEEAAD